jgi:hypothetical protein
MAKLVAERMTHASVLSPKSWVSSRNPPSPRLHVCPFHLSITLIKVQIDRKAPRQDDDSDDFIVPDDAEDSDVLSMSSKDHKRSASRSSIRSVSSKGGPALSGLDDDDEEDDPLPKAVSKKSNRSGGSAKSFLTAAEERAFNKKTEKKTEEKPFDFLKDVKDKDGVRPGQPGYDPRTIFIPKSSWNEFTPFEKQVMSSHRIPFAQAYFWHFIVLGGEQAWIQLYVPPVDTRVDQAESLWHGNDYSFHFGFLLMSGQVLFFQKGPVHAIIQIGFSLISKTAIHRKFLEVGWMSNIALRYS